MEMGLGLLWILYAGWWSGMRVIFILQFLCVMSGIYWHLTRRGAHCAPAGSRGGFEENGRALYTPTKVNAISVGN